MAQLHLPSPVSVSLPLCGRQLNNDREHRAQTVKQAVIAMDLDEFHRALGAIPRGKACKHCARSAGILPKLTRVVRTEEEEE